MKDTIKFTFALLTTFLMLAANTNGQVISGDAVLVSTPGGAFGDFEIGLSQTTSFNGGTSQGLFGYGIELTSPSQLEFEAFGIAEGNSIFPVAPGDQITDVFALANNPLADNSGAFSAGVLNLSAGETVLLGYYDDSNFGDTPDPTDNYGWFELERTNDGLELLGSATSIGRGIIAGTTTTVGVPEPSSALLLGMIAVTAFGRRRRPCVRQIV